MMTSKLEAGPDLYDQCLQLAEGAAHMLSAMSVWFGGVGALITEISLVQKHLNNGSTRDEVMEHYKTIVDIAYDRAEKIASTQKKAN